MRLLTNAALLILVFAATFPGPAQSNSIDLTGVPLCPDVDELPAYSSNEAWASLFEVIAPYQRLCRVPSPDDYTTRVAWPGCLWELPTSNIPKASLWESSHIKSSQSWLKMSGEKVLLPRNGGSLAASKFLAMLPHEIDMAKVKTVLDEGAGVCGLAAEIMVTYEHRPLVLSYAPHDTHTNQVQLCMERGVPAIIFSMARYQFPVPPGSFDMVTCKWCWHWIGAVSIGQWFLEVDRVLRPGGYFVVYAAVWKNHNFKDQVEYWSNALGWRKLKGSGKDMATYRKPDAQEQKVAGSFAPCPPSESSQPSFRRFHVPCRHSSPEGVQVGQAPHTATPEEELQYAQRLLAAMPSSSGFTNVLDANTGNGGFGTALRQLLPQAWTMNIQPVHSVEFHISTNKSGGRSVNYAGMSNFVQAVGTDVLASVFNGGQIGMYHDWCYMYPSYPRSFDFIHVRHLDVSRGNCPSQAMLELDRLLRPGGYIVFSGHGLRSSVTTDVVQPLAWQLAGEMPGAGDQAADAIVFRKLAGSFASKATV